MLTPAKIKNHHFDASGRNAYKAESVDSFFEEVAESYEQMFRENGEMYKKIGLLAERLEEYRKDEDNIRNALLTAQRMAEKITNEAQEKADKLIADAEERAKTENDRVDALTNDALNKAAYQAKAIIDEAQQQADKMMNDATYESKAAAVSARDTMIKEEATLETMKAEVTKFKQQIMDMYNEQFALIEKLPEVVYAKIEAEKEEPVAEEEPVVEVVEEEPVEEVIEETPVEEFPVVEEEPAEEVIEEPVEDKDEIDVEQLRQLIDETEDTDAEDEQPEVQDDEDEVFETPVEEIVLPEIDDNEEEVEKLSEEISSETIPDIMFTKPADDKKDDGFKVNLENITSYNDTVELDDDDDETDDFDDDDDDDDEGNGGFSAKLRGFFKK